MKLLKLTISSSLLFSFLVSMVSCEKEEEKKKAFVYTKSDIAMTGAQAIPASASSATGVLSVYYDKRTQLLNYTFYWSGLTGVPKSIGIYGPAPAGYPALTTTGPAPAMQTISVTGLAVAGNYSGSIVIDGAKFKEEDLLNYLYYITIGTTAYPGGEIRGQIKFQ